MEITHAIALFTFKKSFISARLQIELRYHTTLVAQYSKITAERNCDTCDATLLNRGLYLDFADRVVCIRPEMCVGTLMASHNILPIAFSELTEVKTSYGSTLQTVIHLS